MTMTETKERKYMLGGKAMLLYTELFDRDIMVDLGDSKNLYKIIAVCRKPSTAEHYHEFIESDEFDEMLVSGDFVDALEEIEQDAQLANEKAKKKQTKPRVVKKQTA